MYQSGNKYKKFDNQFAITTSFGIQSSVLLDMVSKLCLQKKIKIFWPVLRTKAFKSHYSTPLAWSAVALARRCRSRATVLAFVFSRSALGNRSGGSAAKFAVREQKKNKCGIPRRGAGPAKQIK